MMLRPRVADLPHPNADLNPNSRVQEVRKGGGRGRPPASEWTHKELKDLVDWLIGLGPGRTEELKHSVRPLPVCPSAAFRTYTHRQTAASPYITLPIPPTRAARVCLVTRLLDSQHRLTCTCTNASRQRGCCVSCKFDVPFRRRLLAPRELRIVVQAGLKKRSEAEVQAMERLVVELIARGCHLDRVDARARFKLFQARRTDEATYRMWM